MLLNGSSRIVWGVADGFSLTLCVGLLVQVSDEFAPHLLVPSQSEGVGQQGGGVQVVQLAGHFQTVQAVLYHGVLSHHRQTQR